MGIGFGLLAVGLLLADVEAANVLVALGLYVASLYYDADHRFILYGLAAHFGLYLSLGILFGLIVRRWRAN